MLFRFQIELADIDRGIYESLDFRVAQHPSETHPYLLSRVLAFCLIYQEGLEFTPGGLADPDAPALRKLGDHNSIELWVEIGNPSARKLHKGSKASKAVHVFTYKNPEVLLHEMKNASVHRAEQIRVTAFDYDLLETLGRKLEKSNKWNLLIQQGQCDLSIGDETVNCPVQQIQ